MSGFVFDELAADDASWIAELPMGIDDVDSLFDALSEVMQFPDYFGRNWDALDECICDLCWLPPGDIALLHKDLPLKNDLHGLKLYLSILSDAVENWSKGESNFMSLYGVENLDVRNGVRHRNFNVVFPAGYRESVLKTMANL